MVWTCFVSIIAPCGGKFGRSNSSKYKYVTLEIIIMNEELEDNWNSIVLKVSTSGGFMVECGTKYKLCVTDYVIDERSGQYNTVFKEFLISKAEFDKILKESLTLKDEMYMMGEADKSNRAATKLRKSRPTKTKTIGNKTAKT
jgi:hypothetical protein